MPGLIKRSIIIFILLFLAGKTAFSQQPILSYNSDIEREMFETYLRDDTIPFGVFTAFMICDNVTDSGDIEKYRGQYGLICESIKNKIKESDSDKKKAKAIFNYLHDDILKLYVPSPTLISLLNEGKYGCLTGTFLFYDQCTRNDIPISLYAAPLHVFSTMEDGDRRIRIEITDPNRGFDTKFNKDIFKYLLEYKFITEEMLRTQGPDNIFRNYVTEVRPISPMELIGYQYYNIAIDRFRNEDYIAGLQNIEKAMAMVREDSIVTYNYKSALVRIPSEFKNDLPACRQYIANSFILLNDSVSLDEICTPIFAVVYEEYLNSTNNMDSARETFAEFRNSIPHDIDNRATYRKFRNSVSQNIAYNYARKGNINDAFNEIITAYNLDSSDVGLIDSRVLISCDYARKIASKGQYDSANAILRPLLEKHPVNYPVIKETYIACNVLGIYSRGLVESDPDSALNIIFELNKLDPGSEAIQELIALIYHTKAMEQVRSNNLSEARKIILEGLDHSPKNTKLTDDLEMVEEQLQN